MTFLIALLKRWPLRRFINLACILSLIGLVCMAFSVLLPWPIPVVFAMSIGQAIGILGLACYVLAVSFDALLQRQGRSSRPPAPGSGSSSSPTSSSGPMSSSGPISK
jgi:hypothetical protein